jgi:hypothetical protein
VQQPRCTQAACSGEGKAGILANGHNEKLHATRAYCWVPGTIARVDGREMLLVSRSNPLCVEPRSAGGESCSPGQGAGAASRAAVYNRQLPLRC